MDNKSFLERQALLNKILEKLYHCGGIKKMNYSISYKPNPKTDEVTLSLEMSADDFIRLFSGVCK